MSRPNGVVVPPEKLREVVDNVMRVLKSEAFGEWMLAPIPALGGRTPMDAMLDGDIDAVVEVTRSYLDPSFG